MKRLTITTNYYNQGAYLTKLIQRWDSFPKAIHDKVRFVVIDDGSREPAESTVPVELEKVDLQVYRILVDIPYNFAGTINLAATVATTPWLLHHDLDCAASAESLAEILSLATAANEDCFFKFYLRFDDGSRVALSSAHLLTAEWFWRLGGVDEDFSGNYGFDDVHLLERVQATSPLKLVQTEIEFMADDNGCAPMERDFRRNQQLLQRKLETRERPAQILRFPWKRVY